MTEMIEMPFEELNDVAPKNHVLHGVKIIPLEWAHEGGGDIWTIVTCLLHANVPAQRTCGGPDHSTAMGT